MGYRKRIAKNKTFVKHYFTIHEDYFYRLNFISKYHSMNSNTSSADQTVFTA
jgi:hypothetical protein